MGKLILPIPASSLSITTSLLSFPAIPTDPIPSPQFLLTAEPELGLCRVLCFSPRHDLPLGRMELPAVANVIDAWCEESSRLSELPSVNSIQIFENRGAMMGASNPHPHCQIWASQTIPTEIGKESDFQRQHFEQTRRCLLCDYLALEAASERMIFQNDSFAAVVPFWAVWPFETLVIGKRHIGSLPELSAAERSDLADVLKRLTTRYDNLFQVSFPYTMGFHQQPCDGSAHEEWHLHAHFYPPLLRSATVRKFMVGYEMLAMPQRDMTPEAAAERLRASSEIHYLDRPGSVRRRFPKYRHSRFSDNRRRSRRETRLLRAFFRNQADGAAAEAGSGHARAIDAGQTRARFRPACPAPRSSLQNRRAGCGATHT